MVSETHQSYGSLLSVAVVSDVGRVRTNNEDAYGFALLDDTSLYVHVADGMGGHEAGEVASSLAVRAMEDTVSADTSVDPRERLYNGMLDANKSILEEASASGTKGMGTTSVVAILRGTEVYVALVGDSRCFHVRSGQVIWRTMDHTRVQMLIDQGEISPEEARGHPEAGMLTRALGHGRMADGRPLVPDVLAEPLSLQEGDALVMSSDGLHDLVDDWEIAKTVAERAPSEAAELLVDMACERGGHDNVTVAVVVVGRRAASYNPDFVPENWPPRNDFEDAEVTYSDYEDDDHSTEQAVAMGLAPEYVGDVPMAEPAKKSGGLMKWGLLAGGLVLLAVLAVVLIGALVGGWFLLL